MTYEATKEGQAVNPDSGSEAACIWSRVKCAYLAAGERDDFGDRLAKKAIAQILEEIRADSRS